jgi:hypothetical protein
VPTGVGRPGRPAANDGSLIPAVSADGLFVAFQSFASNLVARDTNGLADVFVRDRLAQATDGSRSAEGGRCSSTTSAVCGNPDTARGAGRRADRFRGLLGNQRGVGRCPPIARSDRITNPVIVPMASSLCADREDGQSAGGCLVMEGSPSGPTSTTQTDLLAHHSFRGMISISGSGCIGRVADKGLEPDPEPRVAAHVRNSEADRRHPEADPRHPAEEVSIAQHRNPDAHGRHPGDDQRHPAEEISIAQHRNRDAERRHPDADQRRPAERSKDLFRRCRYERSSDAEHGGGQDGVAGPAHLTHDGRDSRDRRHQQARPRREADQWGTRRQATKQVRRP